MKSFVERFYEWEDKNLSSMDEFWQGYSSGVNRYINFPSMTGKAQKETREYFNACAKAAKMGSKNAKGLMLGIKHASNARKNGTLYPPKPLQKRK